MEKVKKAEISPVLMEDMEKLAARIAGEKRLFGASVLITGATGFLGSLMARTMMLSDRLYGTGIRLILSLRNPHKAEAVFMGFPEYERATVLPGDAAQLETALAESGTGNIDYIIHCAAQTQSAEMERHPAEVMEGIALGTRAVLRAVVGRQLKGMVFLSSMEVYGVLPSSGKRTTEQEMGTVRLLAARSCYPEAKRFAECLCFSFFHEYGVPVRIARLAQTFGPGASPEDSRVFMQFARNALAGQNLVLHTDGGSMGNYCYTTDCLRGLLCILLDGRAGEAYNVVNEETTRRIRETAQLVAEEIAGGAIGVEVRKGRAAGRYAPDTGLRLSGEKLRGLGWEPEYGLREMFVRLMRDLRERER